MHVEVVICFVLYCEFWGSKIECSEGIVGFFGWIDSCCDAELISLIGYHYNKLTAVVSIIKIDLIYEFISTGYTYRRLVKPQVDSLEVFGALEESKRTGAYGRWLRLGGYLGLDCLIPVYSHLPLGDIYPLHQ